MNTKKKLLSVIGAIALAAVASWNVYQSRQEATLSDLMLENIERQEATLSDLMLENIEALASGEGTCEICYGFILVTYSENYKVCEQKDYGPCNIHDQMPC